MKEKLESFGPDVPKQNPEPTIETLSNTPPPVEEKYRFERVGKTKQELDDAKKADKASSDIELARLHRDVEKAYSGENPHEKYHSTDSEERRHIRFIDMDFEEQGWDLHQEALQGLDPLTLEIEPGAVSPGEANNFIWEQKEKEKRAFDDSLGNPEEQRARKEMREVFINFLESVYGSLDRSAFTSRDEGKRSAELQRVLKERAGTVKDKKIQDMLASLYHPYGFKTQTINDVDKFIEAALIQFDPLIFKVAQREVEGRISGGGYKEAFEREFTKIQKGTNPNRLK